MGLIEFIFQNPFVMLILIGILTSLFGKKKQEEQKQRQRQRSNPQGRPAPQPIEVPWENYELDPIEDEPVNHSKNSGKQTQAQGRENHRTPRSIEWYDESTVNSTQPASSTPIETYVERVQVAPANRSVLPTAKQDSKRSSTQGHRAIDFKHINGQNVVQGIIWSQVLGAPRSREPHRSSAYRFGPRR